jgi:hypothetical protein
MLPFYDSICLPQCKMGEIYGLTSENYDLKGRAQKEILTYTPKKNLRSSNTTTPVL